MKLTIPLFLSLLSPPVPNTSSLMNNCYTPLTSSLLSPLLSSSSYSSLCPPFSSSSSVLLSICHSISLSLPFFALGFSSISHSHSPFSSLLSPLLSSPSSTPSSLHLSRSSFLPCLSVYSLHFCRGKCLSPLQSPSLTNSPSFPNTSPWLLSLPPMNPLTFSVISGDAWSRIRCDRMGSSCCIHSIDAVI